MQVTETSSEGLKREFSIVVPAADIQAKMDQRLQELGSEVKLPGFRPGKVPMPVLKQRFGQSVMGEVLERTVNEASMKAMTEKGLKPAGQPKVEVKSFEDGKDLVYSISLEILPEIKIADFSTFSLTKLKVKVPDDEVQKSLDNLAQSQRKTQAPETPRAAKSGDVVVIDFEGTVDGNAFPGMSGQDHQLELGSNAFVQGFEEQLVGAKADDKRDVTVTFPDEYVNDQLKGKEAVFAVTVKQVLEVIPTPIDDELAKSMGAESLDDMTNKVRERIGQEYDNVARSHMKRELLDKLDAAHAFSVPDGMAQSEFDAIWQQVSAAKEKGEMDEDDKDKSEDELKAEYRTIAERRVRLGLLLSEIGQTNKIEVTQEEVNQAVMAEARRYPGQEQKVFEYFQKNPQAVANIRAPIFEDKVIDFILNLAKTDEKEVTPEELFAYGQDEGTAAKSEKKPAAKKAAAKSKKKD